MSGLSGGTSLHWGGVYVVGHYAYIGEGSALTVLDVSNPTRPVVLGRVDNCGGWVQVRNGLACTVGGIHGFKIADVTNPSSPTLRGSYPKYAVGVFVSGTSAYIASADDGLLIVDVTNPSSPTLLGSYDTPFAASDVSVSGDMAYVVDGTSLQIIDVANPSSPVLRSSYPTASWGYAWNGFVSDRVAYVTASRGGFTGEPAYATFLAIDVANPAAPKLLSQYVTAGRGGGVFVSHGFAYVMLGQGLHIFDIRNPSSPTLCGFYPLDPGSPGDARLFVSGDLVYVMLDRLGLHILQFTGRPAEASRHWPLYR